MRALEPRILLDAAAMETVADTVSAAVHANLADTYVAKNSVNLDVNFAPTEGLANSIGPVFDADAEFDHVQETSQTAIAFISADVPNVVKLVSALSPETEVVLLDATSDGIEQIADFLDGRTDIDAIHLISHGAEGSLSLGNAQLNSETMSENYRQQLSQIGNALSEDGDILIYGCNFGSGVIGNRAAQVLAEITGADVAASTDLTGSAELGGDWVLESRTGSIEADTIDAEEHWFGVLPTAIIESHEVPLNEIDHDEKTGGNTIIGQNFSHSSAEAQYEVVQIDLVLGLKDNPAVQNVIVTIRESPTGPILASGTIQSTELSTTADWHSVTLDAGVLLNSGDNYVFMIGTDSHTGESSITVGVEHDSSYAGGEAVDKNGNDRSDHYTLFRMHGTVNSSPTITSNGGGAWVFPSVDENQTFVTTVEATDADVPGDTLSYSITGGADASKFTIDPVSGDLSFLVAPDYENPTDAFPFNGIYSVVVEVSDGRGGTDSQTLSVVVEDIDEINDAPVATAGDVSTSEDVPVDGSIVMSDPDVGDVLQATLGTDATNGSVIVNLDGTFTYTPDANYAGPDNFTIVVTDQDGLSDTVTVNVTVAPFNDAPVGTTAPLSTLEDNQVSGTITMTDPDAGDMVQASLVTVPANGQAIVNPDGTFTYTPNAEFSGDDSFTAMVTDSDGLFDTVTVNVTVSPVNDAPRAYDDSVNVMENTATALALTVPTDVDDADANLTITINQVPSPAQGTLTYIQDGGGTANVGIGSTLSKNELTTLVFTPAPSYSGSVDDIVYTVTDDDNFSDLTSVATVNLTINGVNDAPDAYNNSVNVTEDTVTAISPTVPTDVDNVATDLTVTVNQVPPSNQGTFSYTLDIGGSANVTVGTTMSIAEFTSLNDDRAG